MKLRYRLSFSALLPFIFHSVVISSPLSKEYLEKAKKLGRFGFDYFNQETHFQGTRAWDEKALEKHATNPEFKLLYSSLPEIGGEFDAKKATKLLLISEFYFATGEAVERVFDLFFKHAPPSSRTLPSLKSFIYIGNEMKNYLIKKNRFNLQMKDNSIEFDGWKVTREDKRIALWLLFNLAQFFDSVTIKNLPIIPRYFKRIQSIWESNLTTVRLVNCPLLFTFSSPQQFNFSKLVNLKAFQFSKCYCKKMEEMLSTIPIGNLIDLDISNSIIETEIVEEMLLKMKRLEILNVSSDIPITWQNKIFSGALLTLPNLKELNAKFQSDLDSFVNELGKIRRPLKLKHLDISGYTFHPSESKIFIENLKKLSHLISLNSSRFQFEDFKEFTSQIHKLKSLEKIRFLYIHPEESAELIKQIILRKLLLKFGSNFDYYYARNIEELGYSDKINLGLFSHPLIPSNLPEGSFYIFDLVVSFTPFNESNPKHVKSFFSKFLNLTHLSVTLTKSSELVYLNLLLANNSIEKLQITLYSFSGTPNELMKILKNRSFKSFKISKIISDENNYDSLLQKLTKTKFWRKLESFEYEFLSLKSLVFILSNIKFTQLHTFIGKCMECSVNDPSVITTPFELATVRRVKIHCHYNQQRRIIQDNLIPLMKVFSQAAEFDLQLNDRIISYFDISTFKNLNSLQIKCRELKNYEKVMEQLISLPLLIRFVFAEELQPFFTGKFRFGRHENFPNLAFSNLFTGNNQIIRKFWPDTLPGKKVAKPELRNSFCFFVKPDSQVGTDSSDSE